MLDAVVGASQVLVAIAARSLAAVADDVTLPQYRALVVLASQGPQSVAELAAVLGVLPSTVTRMCDRLVRKRLARRHRPPSDRRTVRIAVTDAGRQLVADVTRVRRTEVNKVLRAMNPEARAHLVQALGAFNRAAGEVPEQDWSSGWGRE